MGLFFVLRNLKQSTTPLKIKTSVVLFLKLMLVKWNIENDNFKTY